MTNAEAWFDKSLRPRKPEGSLGRTAQDGHLDSHTAPEPCVGLMDNVSRFCSAFGPLEGYNSRITLSCLVPNMSARHLRTLSPISSSSSAAVVRAQELCESRGGHPGLPVPNSPYGLCGRKAALNLNCVKVEVAVLGSPSPVVPIWPLWT